MWTLNILLKSIGRNLFEFIESYLIFHPRIGYIWEDSVVVNFEFVKKCSLGLNLICFLKELSGVTALLFLRQIGKFEIVCLPYFGFFCSNFVKFQKK